VRTVDLSKQPVLPPHSIEAEQGYLGCLLLAPESTLESSPLDPSAFYDLRHKMLSEKIIEWSVAGMPIDLVTVSCKLRDAQQLEALGGVAYLSQLMDAVPSAANAPYYRDIIREKAALRAMREYHEESILEIYTFDGEFDKYVAQSRGKFDSVMDVVHQTPVDAMDGKAGAIAFMNEADRLMQNKGAYTGVPTGWKNYDKITWGLQHGQMNVIGARPSTGKTSALCDVVNNAAVVERIPTLVFSYEMTKERIYFRLACQLARVNSKHLKEGVITEGDMSRLNSAISRISSAPIYVIDNSRITVPEMRPIVRHFMKTKGVKLACIDYLQKIPAARGREKKHEEVASVSTDLQDLFKDTGAASLILAQLNRDADEQRPKMSDMGQSGQIETDADTITLLWRDPKFQLDDPFWRYQFMVAKSRDGENGIAHMKFFREHTHFEASDERFKFN
jgi:replicative DNA helicase